MIIEATGEEGMQEIHEIKFENLECVPQTSTTNLTSISTSTSTAIPFN